MQELLLRAAVTLRVLHDWSLVLHDWSLTRSLAPLFARSSVWLTEMTWGELCTLLGAMVAASLALVRTLLRGGLGVAALRCLSMPR